MENMQLLVQKIINYKKWIIVALAMYVVLFFAIGAYYFFHPVDRINFTIYMPTQKGAYDAPELLIEGDGETLNPRVVLSPRVRVGFTITTNDNWLRVLEERATVPVYGCSVDSWHWCEEGRTADGVEYVHDRKAERGDVYIERVRFVKDGTAIEMSAYVNTVGKLSDAYWSKTIASLVPTVMKEGELGVSAGEYHGIMSSGPPRELKLLGIPIYESLL